VRDVPYSTLHTPYSKYKLQSIAVDDNTNTMSRAGCSVLTNSASATRTGPGLARRHGTRTSDRGTIRPTLLQNGVVYLCVSVCICTCVSVYLTPVWIHWIRIFVLGHPTMLHQHFASLQSSAESANHVPLPSSPAEPRFTAHRLRLPLTPTG